MTKRTNTRGSRRTTTRAATNHANNSSREGDQGQKGNDFRWPLAVNPDYYLHLKRPPPLVMQGLLAKAEELYPDPPFPTQTVQTPGGGEEEVPYGPDHPLVEAYQEAQQAAANARVQYMLDFLYNHRMVIETADGEEIPTDDLIAEYADELASYRAVMDIDEALDEWQATLRFVLISTPEELLRLYMISGMAAEMSDVSQEEVLHSLAKFRY